MRERRIIYFHKWSVRVFSRSRLRVTRSLHLRLGWVGEAVEEVVEEVVDTVEVVETIEAVGESKGVCVRPAVTVLVVAGGPSATIGLGGPLEP